VTRFLRLFRAYREAVAIANWEREGRAAEVALWRVRCEAAEARVRELTDKMLEDRARLADTMSLHAIGKRIYSKADPVPVDAVAPRIVQGRVFARHAQQQQTAQFFENLRKELKPTTAS
jgi:hypothetical protein